MNKTQERVAKVLERIAAMCAANESAADMWSGELEDMLFDMHSGDAFGSEGQCDPRGDFRNGDWSMDCVEGVD